mmetsp:Transcript_42793/g.119066  ORF Transcript_42793/g.119066 Transcript_42793/m.119066 type:complete len:233 (-) Transcript_42793:117-815(-)
MVLVAAEPRRGFVRQRVHAHRGRGRRVPHGGVGAWRIRLRAGAGVGGPLAGARGVREPPGLGALQAPHRHAPRRGRDLLVHIGVQHPGLHAEALAAGLVHAVEPIWMGPQPGVDHDVAPPSDHAAARALLLHAQGRRGAQRRRAQSPRQGERVRGRGPIHVAGGGRGGGAVGGAVGPLVGRALPPARPRQGRGIREGRGAGGSCGRQRHAPRLKPTARAGPCAHAGEKIARA